MFDTPDFDDHEEVVSVSCPRSGLRAVIAIHSTALGPGLGGVRCWPYRSGMEAIRDALRLSRGMTYKNALAGLDLGGGKSVILGDPKTARSPEALRAFARAIDRLDGRYIGAEDVGMTVADIDLMRDVTPHLAGTSWGAAASGDPSPYTAEGVFLGLKATVAAANGSDDLTGARIGVMGLGAVGWKLAEKLVEAGASLIVADVDVPRTVRAAARLGADIIDPARLPFEPMDVFAPCALGGVLTRDFAESAPVKLICGAANNQLATPDVDAALWETGKLYAPDYLVNAGGVINVAAEAGGEYDAYRVGMKVREIAATTATVIEQARRENRPTGEIADAMALARIDAAHPQDERARG
jgi:leucine dehydrogenase